jgi:hypothetical protein
MATLRSLFQHYPNFHEGQGEKRSSAIQLADIDTIDKLSTSLLTDSKGLVLIHLKKGEGKVACHPI